MFTRKEFQDLSNRSEKAFWFLMNGPTHPTSLDWEARTVVNNRDAYQRALAAWAKANPGNGELDMIQLRALEHLSYIDRVLWHAFSGKQCQRRKSGSGGDSIWYCHRHGQKIMCRKAYEDWLAKHNY